MPRPIPIPTPTDDGMAGSDLSDAIGRGGMRSQQPIVVTQSQTTSAEDVVQTIICPLSSSQAPSFQMPNLPDEQSIIRRAIERCWGIGTPYDYQIETICEIAIRKKNIFLIRKTGEGKSIVPWTVAALRKCITIILVPLIGLGSDQVSKASRLELGIEAYHLDKIGMETLINCTNNCDHSEIHETVILFASPNCLQTESRWRPLFFQMAKHGLISLFAIDEAHCVVTDGRSFCCEFQSGISAFLDIINSSPTKVPILAMTATLRQHHQQQLSQILKLTPDVVCWGNMDRRSIAITVSIEALPCQAMMKKLVAHFKKKTLAKRLIYSNSALAAETDLKAMGESVLKECNLDGVVLPLTGSSGIMQKMWLMNLFCNPNASPRLSIFPVTAAANCGVSSNECDGAEAYGLPPNMYEFVQQLGRADRKNIGQPGENEYGIHLSFDLFLKLLLHVWSTTDRHERDILMDDLFEVLILVVLPKQCYHVALEEKMESCPNAQVRLPCWDSCPFCTGESRQFTDAFDHQALMSILQGDIFYDGWVSIKDIIKQLSQDNNKQRLFGRGYSSK
ncbi:hypothetical protein ACHAXS_012774 [Conticribra weissflogii]